MDLEPLCYNYYIVVHTLHSTVSATHSIWIRVHSTTEAIGTVAARKNEQISVGEWEFCVCVVHPLEGSENEDNEVINNSCLAV